MAERLRLYRLLKQRYARQALSGRGGLEADGRWHSAGRLVAYLASSEALAVLELRVHLGSIVPSEPYMLVTVDVPERVVMTLPNRQWPRRWDAIPFSAETQRIGDAWLAGGSAAALRVPSVHSASDYNVIVNPTHPDARRLRIVNRARYRFDARLFV
jgi:RES domain-containing protein